MQATALLENRLPFVLGLVKTGLMAVIAQAVANLRCLRARAARTGDRTDPLTRLDPEDHGFEEIDQATAPPASTGPRPAPERSQPASHQPARQRAPRVGAVRVDPPPEPARSPAALP